MWDGKRFAISRLFALEIQLITPPQSRPSRACGLKLTLLQDQLLLVVAPFTGVWIETLTAAAVTIVACRALHGRVD